MNRCGLLNSIQLMSSGSIMHVQFVISNRLRPGGPNVDLRPPNHIKRIRGDGNCLFRSIS